MRVEIPISDEQVASKIYYFRGHKVMLDKDLSVLYDVDTKRLKEQVKRNIDIFPKHFMFELTSKEMTNLRSQFATSSWGGSRYLSYAFTELGILQLANVLKSKRARKMSIRIIEVFIKMRQLLETNKEILIKLNQLEKKLLFQDDKVHKLNEEIQMIFEYIKNLLNPEMSPRKSIGYKI